MGFSNAKGSRTMSGLTLKGQYMLTHFCTLSLPEQLGTLKHTYMIAQEAENANDQQVSDEMHLLAMALRNVVVKERLSNKKSTRRKGIKKAQKLKEEAQQQLLDIKHRLDTVLMSAALPFQHDEQQLFSNEILSRVQHERDAAKSQQGPGDIGDPAAVEPED